LIEWNGLSGKLELKNLSYLSKFHSNQAYARLGWSIGFQDFNADGIDDLFISEPMRDTKIGQNSGQVYLIKGGSKFPRGDIQDMERISKVYKGKKKSRFGFTIISGINPHGKMGIFISSPMCNENGRNSGSFEFHIQS
jgi:hypothetical protein